MRYYLYVLCLLGLFGMTDAAAQAKSSAPTGGGVTEAVEPSAETINGRVVETATVDGEPVWQPDPTLAQGVGEWQPEERRLYRVTQQISESPAYRMTYVALPLVAAGVVLNDFNEPFRTLRNDYIPGTRIYVDDVTQYLPAALMLGLKAAGVEGRSSWGRMLVADLFSVAICTAIVQSIKYTAGVQRPDGSNYKSFPSGHTATAFMVASMLHHEYGLTRSRWYSIGGYSLAIATGVMRMVNNRHWLGDVVAGAGIGILSVELGYFLTGLIFKERGLRRDYLPQEWEPQHAPSMVGLALGYDFLLGGYDLSGGERVRFDTGGSAAVEGAWFWNNHWGIGAKVGVASHPWQVNGTPADEDLKVIRSALGAYYSLPLGRRWLAGAKVQAEYARSMAADWRREAKPTDALRIGDRNAFGLGAGISMTFLTRASMGITLFADYGTSTSLLEAGGAWNHHIVTGGQFHVAF